MNKKKEEKREKVLKILKIIGSAIGLTLCSAGFIALLVIGLRGCAHNSSNTALQSGAVVERDDKLSKRQLNSLTSAQDYVNDYPLYGHNDALFTDIDDLQGDSKAGYYNNTYQFTYNDNVVSGGYIAVSVGGANNLFSVQFKEYSTSDEYIFRYVARWDNNSEYLEVNEVKSDVFGFSWYKNENKNIVNNLLYDLSFLLPYQAISSWELYNYLEHWVYAYFSLDTLVDNFEEPVNVYFNTVINPYAPYGQNLDYFINLTLNGEQFLSTGLFEDSQGVMYYGISIFYSNAGRVRFGTTDNYNTYFGESASYYMNMCYYRVSDGKKITVNSQNYGTATSGDEVGNTVMLLGNHWNSAIYQDIKIYALHDGSGVMNTNATRLSVITSLNNVSDYTGLTNVGGGTVGTLSVFTLIASAFTALAPIFNTYILPGVNLWTLLLVPLVGSIVLFIVWLFKR